MEPGITGLEFYTDAFDELSTSRPVGMAIGAIPFTAIAEYFRIYGLEDDFDEFTYVIRRMDGAFLELKAAEFDKPNKKPGEGKRGDSDSNKKNHSQGRHKRR